MEDIKELAGEFRACRKIFSALGDENRQHLILEMMQMENCSGVRIGDITARTHLSRAAASHHLAVLKEAGIVNMRREGRKNYYYFDMDAETIGRLRRLFGHVENVMKSLPDRGEEEL